MNPATLTPTEELIARRIDFPTWLPAMLVKEMRQGLRARGFVGTLVGFQVVMTLFVIFAIAGGTGSISFNILQGAFWVMLNVQLLIVTPVRALMGLQAELDSRWVDLLMLTRLTAWRIVLGKWISLLFQAALLVIAMLPYGVARYFFGSVDLVGELKLIGLIFAGSAVLTAAALWSSALPKIARVVLGFLIFFSWQFVPGSLQMLFSSGSRPMRMSGPAGFLTTANAWLAVFDALLVLALCLLGAVRRLAPRAESQTAITRLLPLLAFVPVPFLSRNEAAGQFAIAIILFAFVAALELARSEEPMDHHWRAWSRRGTWGRLVGRFVQPGWASALEWLMIVTVVVALCGLTIRSTGVWEGKIALLALLAAEALVLPALLHTWAGPRFTQRAAGYALVLGGASLIAAVGAGMGSMGRGSEIIDRVMLLVPISSFWATMGLKVAPAPGVLVAQLAIAVAILGGAWWRARPYRLQRKAFETMPEEEQQHAAG